MGKNPKRLNQYLVYKKTQKTRIAFPSFMKPQLDMGGEAAKFELPMSQINEISD